MTQLAATPEASAVDPETPDAPTVLIIEDNDQLRHMLIEALSGDYQTIAATDGESGLQVAIERAPHLIVLDVGLPRMDGRSVLRALRAHPTASDVPVLIVTGAHDRRRNLDLLREGAQDLLLKPFSLPELEVRVRNLVRAKMTRDLLNETIGQHETDLFKLAGRVAQQQAQLQQTLSELRVAQRVAERANRTKGNFLRMMSHELKTPVAALQLHMRLIERGAGPQISPELEDGIARMGRSTRRLLHLVDTFLEWSRAEQERTQLNPEDVSLEAIALDVAREMNAYAVQKGLSIEVHTQGLPALRSDPKILRLLLCHLVYRAVQVSRSGVLVLRVAACDQAQAVSVHDTATPLSPSQQAEVLDLLEDPSDISRRAGAGSGLGVRVVRDIARGVGGELTLRAGRDQGNVFTLTVPPVAADPVRAVPHSFAWPS